MAKVATFTVVIGGQQVTGTPAQLSELAAEFRAKRYAERKNANKMEAHAAGQAAYDSFVAETLASAQAKDTLLTEDDITEMERQAKRLRAAATRAKYLELGYGTCVVETCDQLTSPLPGGGTYQFCVDHQPRR